VKAKGSLRTHAQLIRAVLGDGWVFEKKLHSRKIITIIMMKWNGFQKRALEGPPTLGLGWWQLKD